MAPYSVTRFRYDSEGARRKVRPSGLVKRYHTKPNEKGGAEFSLGI